MASMTAYHCASGKQCVWWVEKVLRECVCGMRDYVSVVLGLISLLRWGVAEVPQILTNFKSGCTDGVSLGFLMTWVVGDLFNLIGCWLEPATLPTQFYTALLYTITTIVLVCQIIYYDHIYNWWKMKTAISQLTIQPEQISECEQNDHEKAERVRIPESSDHSSAMIMKTRADSNIISTNPMPSLPIPHVSPRQKPNSGSDLYYTSARSFASSHTPTPGSYLLHQCGPRYLDKSSEEEEGLLTNLISASPKKPTAILPSIAPTILFLGGLHYFDLPNYNNIISTSYSSQELKTSSFIITGRKLLQGRGGGAFSLVVADEPSSPLLGTCLGWLMASIYKGGRLPQICLNASVYNVLFQFNSCNSRSFMANIKRGTVEGLNPLMFIFALVGNATYVGSILVRTVEWKKLKPNMPWLIDAAACVLLDFFILVQFIYYKVKRTVTGGVAKNEGFAMLQ